MINWLGDREYKIYAWSDSDYSQLSHEIKSKAIDDPKVASFMNREKWIDYQAVFGKRFDFSRAVSLEEALLGCEIDVEGRLHDGLDDAVNTAKLIKTLEQDENFSLCDYEKEYRFSSKRLGFCMGDLFAGLNLGCIA